jgi:hypothetical protein
MSMGQKLGEIPAQTKIAGATVASSLGLGTLGAIMFADWRPYFVAFLVMVILGAAAWFSTRFWERAKKKRDAKRFSEDLDDGLGDDAGGSGADKAEQENLRRKFLEGVTEYQRAGISVYDSPWLVLVGPPSAGKSVLLQKCGLVDAKDLQQGVGGTRGMNWWFIDAESNGESIHSVVLDMAGAVFMDQRQEGRWETFLQFLKRHRKYEPLNGVMLVVSVQDLLGKTPEQLATEGGQVRNQLEKIRAQLDIRFPVWVIVTKCDLIDGFKEFTEAIDRAGAGQMLGWSKPGKLDAPFDPKGVKEFIDGIVERLRVFRTKTLADMVMGPPTGDRQADRSDTLFGLPGSFAELGASLQKYLEIVFARKKISTAPPFMRGIYFTSSERKGASISKALKELGIQPVEEQWPDRSFFNKDVFGQKVFRETLLVTTADSVDRMRRSRKVAAYVTGMVAALVLAGLSVWSFFGVSRTIGNVTGFYTQLREAWPKLETVDWKGNGAEELHISDQLAKPCSSLADVLQKSAEYSGERVRTPLVFFPIRLFAGDVGMNAERAAIHRELVSRTLLRPVLQKSLDALGKRSTWSVESFDQIDRLKHAGDALVQIVHFGNLMETSAASGSAPPSIDPPIRLRPLLEFLKDQGDPIAADWLKTDQADRLGVLLVGAPASASGPAVAGALTQANVAQYRSSLDSVKVTVALDAFRQEVASEIAGQSGLLLKITELDAAVKGAVAAPDAFAKLVTSSVDSLESYNKFGKDWIEQSAALGAKVDDAQDRSAKLKVSANWLTDFSGFMDDLGREYTAVDHEVDAVSIDLASKNGVPPGSIDTLKAWKAAIRPENKALDVSGAAAKKNDASTLLQRCLAYVSRVDPKAETSAIQYAKMMAAEVGSALSDKPEDKLGAPGDSLVWNREEADKRADGILRDRQSMIDGVRVRGATWPLPSEGTNTSFATRAADQCLAGLRIVKRRYVGVQLEQYVSRLSKAGAGLKDAVAKNITPPHIEGLPMSRLEHDGGGNIAAEYCPDALVGFLGGWEGVRTSICPETAPDLPRAGPSEAPIVDSSAIASSCVTARQAVKDYRDAAWKYWNTDIVDKLGVSEGVASWKDYQAELNKLMRPGAGRAACDSLAKILEMRDKCIAALKGDAPDKQWKWDAYSKANLEGTVRSCLEWLGLWGALPADSVAARTQLNAPSSPGANYMALCDLPYWHQLALKGLTTLNTDVSGELGGKCSEFQQKAGMPLMRGAIRPLEVADRERIRDLACMLKTSAPKPGETGGSHSLVRPRAAGPACALEQAASDLDRAGGTGCSNVTPEACRLAQMLAAGIKLTIQPSNKLTPEQASHLITGTYPDLAVAAANRPPGGFKLATEMVTIDCPATQPIVFEFSNEGGKVQLNLTPWHFLSLIAAGGVGGDGTTYDIYIPDVTRCDAFTAGTGTPPNLALAVKITVQGSDKLPLDKDWPMAAK